MGPDITDGLSDAVRNRLAAFRSSGDSRVILDGQAAGEIAALRESIGWPPFGPRPSGAVIRRQLEVVLLAGRAQFIRCRELPPGDRVEAWLEAMELFTAVYPLAPDAVPEPMRPMCGALAGNPPGVHHAELHNEAIDMLDAAEVTRDRAEVDQAIWLIASAFLAAPQDQDRARHLSVLGTGWTERFRITGRIADLDNAVTAHRRALALGGPGAADRAGHQANYSGALLARYENTGSVADLDEAVAAARAATQTARTEAARAGAGGGRRRSAWPDEAGQDRTLALRHAIRTSESALAAALLRRYLYGRAQADLDEAIVAGRASVTTAAAGDPARPGLQANLANLLLERFTRGWQLADLTDAVAIAQAAAEAATDRDPARAAALSALALAHLDHFWYSGNLQDLDRAISAGRESVAAAGDGHPGAAACLSNLGAALRTRYERTGDTRALDEAITRLRQAVRVAPAGDVSLPGFLNNLGNALRSRFGASVTAAGPAVTDPASTGPADIQASVEVLTRAVAGAHRGSPDRPGYVANLANSLILAAEHDAYPGALDQAISTLEQETGTIGDDHPLRHTCLMSLGWAWLARFDASGDEQALEAAIGHLGRAAEAIPADHPHRAEYLARLGSALQRKVERTQDPAGALDGAVARDAIAASKAAATIGTAPAVIRVLAARDWAQVAARMGDAAEAVDGFSVAVNLLDRVAWRGLQRRDQERNLGQFAALACDAAAWAIEAGDPERAVELLEQGRGVLLTQALDQRARQHDLRRADPDLAGLLAGIDDSLEYVPAADDPLRAADPVLAGRRRDLVRQREDVLARIRRLPGFADFLRPPAFATLRDAAAQGPVVIVNVSGYRCDALVVTASGVQITRLPGLTGAGVVPRVAAFLAAVRQPGPGQAITPTLAWLWDTIAAPLLPVLTAACAGSHAGPAGQRPRIWWCPTGPLTFLPLHAAGRHDRAGESVLDHFICSYTPTLRLLRYARARAGVTGGTGKPLVVALPETLPNAAVEADFFAGLFHPASQLRGSGATVRAVRHALQQSPPLAHFACHGQQEITDPSAGCLWLHDGKLGITDIAGLRLEAAELAYLSACETSTGGIQLSDEAITLATAFALAGYRHVIGTLWSISDRHAPNVARHVYQCLKRPADGGMEVGGTGAALDSAVLALREKQTQPWLWASYVHLGP